MRGQPLHHRLLRGHGGGGCRGSDLDRDHESAGAFDLGVQRTGAADPEHAVGFPMPELGAVLDLRGAVMDRDPEPDLGCAADLTGGSSPPPCALPARQVLPQLQVALRGGVDPRVHGLVADPHHRVLGELQRQPPGDLLRGPAPSQMLTDVTDQPVMTHPTRLMAALRGSASMGLGDRGPVVTRGPLPGA